ncbi:threonine ammonia-lyase [Fodinicurvata sediminis]|uniref:threonine ammonia-lyase n=1 Tax=Fodinicurvata sediminis TaxID=1121832 RepID=UPI0003B3ED78|nr:threonine ammonia-lyase [Fodinicurvata sediminis]
MALTLQEIEKAAEGISGEIVRTPVVPAARLSETLGCDLHLKLENLQYTGSFKDRGACWKLLNLAPEQSRYGVIAMSAGNHAQGVAYHAKRLGIPATIVMPEFAPFSKVERTRSYGAKVVQTGETIDASAQAARDIAEAENLALVHPYDDPFIIAGQGTIGLELMTDLRDADCVVVPIGGGGLISGIASAIKAINPTVEIVGVETELFPSMYQALHDMPPSSGGTTLADGIAVKSPGKLTRSIIKELVSDILLVDEASLETAVHYLVERQKIVAEGAGAAGVAALFAHPERFRGRRVTSIICGGNIDVRLLSGVLARGLIRDGRVVRLRIEIIDQPRQLARLSEVIGGAGGNIIEVYHQRLFADVPAKRADVDVVVETRNIEHVQEIISALHKAGFESRALSTRSVDGGF